MATRRLTVEVIGDTRSLDRALGRSGKSVNTFGSVAKKALGAAGVGGFGVLAKSAIGAASDIDESLSKNRVLFGRFAKDIEKFSSTSAKSFGVSKRAALEYTGVFGNLFRSLGQSEKASAGMSVKLTKLASDMASFNNTSIEDALEAIRSGLVGETEPLRKFGVNMNDATLRAEALRLGLIKNTKDALDPQTKALAANSLIYRQTSKAHGDFERTSGSLANKQKTLKAEYEDVSAKLGQSLIPAMKTATGALTSFFDWTSKNEGKAKALAIAVTGVGTAIGIGLAANKVKQAAEGLSGMLTTGKKVTDKLIDTFGLSGTRAGRTLATNAAASTATNMGPALDRQQAGITGGQSGGRWGRFGTIIGRTMGAALVVSLAYTYRKEIRSFLAEIEKELGINLGTTKVPLSPRDQRALDEQRRRQINPFPVPGPPPGTPVPRAQHGGFISGHGRGDIVPAMLEPGEFVIRRKVVERFGPTYFHQLNAQRFAGGGQVSKGSDWVLNGQFNWPTPQGFANGGLVHRAAVAAGFRGNALRIAQAVAQAESGGRPGAIGDRHLGGSHGLWQVHLPSHPNYDPQKLFDPFYNARAAFAISSGGRNWNPWTTFRTGAYRRFLGQSISGTPATPGRAPASRSPRRPLGSRLGISKGAGAGNVPGMGRVVGGELKDPIDMGFTPGLGLDTGAAELPTTGPFRAPSGPTSGTPSRTGTTFSTMSEYVQAWIDEIDLKERAGDLTPAQAHAARRDLIIRALNGEFGPMSATDRLRLRGDLRQLDQQAAANIGPDLQAQLDQANLKARVATRAAQLSDAGLGAFRGAGDIGYGVNGMTFIQNNQMLVPGTPQQMALLAGSTVRAFDSEGARTTSVHASGV